MCFLGWGWGQLYVGLHRTYVAMNVEQKECGRERTTGYEVANRMVTSVRGVAGYTKTSIWFRVLTSDNPLVLAVSAATATLVVAVSAATATLTVTVQNMQGLLFTGRLISSRIP